jgi:hypothetical protein
MKMRWMILFVGSLLLAAGVYFVVQQRPDRHAQPPPQAKSFLPPAMFNAAALSHAAPDVRPVPKPHLDSIPARLTIIMGQEDGVLPTLGRWLVRDPDEKHAGVHMYSFMLNRAVNFIDPLGLYSWSFGTLNLGQRNPVAILDHPGSTLKGLTTFEQSVIPDVVSSGCDRGKRRVDVTGDANATFWWADAGALTHEQHHVDLHKAMWNELENNINIYSGCVCPKVAKCYKEIIYLLVDAHVIRDRARNNQFDCDQYDRAAGGIFGNCMNAESLGVAAQRHWDAVTAKNQECSSL